MATYNVGYNAAGTLLDYATINDAFAAASAGDTLILWYSNTSRNPAWIGQINSGSATTKNVNLIGGLGTQKTTILCYNIGTFYNWTPNTPDNSLLIQNLTFRLIYFAGSTICLKFDGTASGNSAVVDSCRFIGGFYFGIQCYASFSQTIKNCFFCCLARPVLGDSDSTVYLYNSTAINCPLSINLQNAGEIKNCVFINAGATQYFGAGVTASNNASTDTAPGTSGQSNLIFDELRFWATDLGGYGLIAPQIFPDSALASGGTDVGLTTDIDGLAYNAGVYPIGCSRGHTILPNIGTVLDSETYNGLVPISGTFSNLSESAAVLGTSWGEDGTEYSGNVVLPNPSEVLFGVNFGANASEYTGTYVPGSPAPGESDNSLAAEIAIRELLLSDETIYSLIGVRVYPVVTPQNPSFPMVVYGLRNTERLSHIAGSENIANKTIRIDAYAESYAAVKSVSEAVSRLLHGYAGTIVLGEDSIKFTMILLEEESDSEPVLIRPGSDEFVYAVNMAFNVWY